MTKIRDKILIIGAAIIDVLVVPAEPSVFDTGSYPAEHISMSPGGDGLNEAIVLSRMGKKISFETIVGEDMAGDVIRKYCRDEGIEIHPDQIRRDIKTGINVVLVQANGERNFLTSAGSSLRRLRLEDIGRPFAKDIKIMCFASIFVFPEIGCAELAELFKGAKEQGITVCADMTKCKRGEKASDMAPAFRYVDYLFANEEEAFLLTGESFPREAAAVLWNSGAGHVVIKCGARGCYIKSDDYEEAVPGVTAESCIDTTGAGDSFAAGFICALSDGRSFRECAQYGNQCGARAVSVIGAAEWID